MAEPSTVIDFRLPSLGSDMEEGTIIEWNVDVGDTVSKGDALLAVETEKGDIDVETWDDGVITEICASVGTTVPVGTVIARLTAAGTAAPTPTPAPSPAVAPPPSAEIPPARPAPRASPSRGAGSPFVSPRLVFWPSPPALGSTETGGEDDQDDRDDHAAGIDDPMRRAIARTMSRANREIPHYHLTHAIDLEAAQQWLTRHNESVVPEQRVVMAALLTKATATAAGAVPELNGHWTDRGLQPADDINISLIVRRRDGGIVAPVIHSADGCTVGEIMANLTDLVTRSKRADLRAADLADPTITITNLGDRGVDSVLGVIQPPQVALVGFGRVEPRPVVVDGEVTARPTVTATLSGDHRATDGQTGARFLQAIDRALQEPENL